MTILSFVWYDPDRGCAMAMELLNKARDFRVLLHIPHVSEVSTAGQVAFWDTVRAAQSSSYFLYLVGQPLVRFSAWVVYWIGWFIYKYILVEGVYNNGLSQAKELALMYWKWQTNLTRQQLLLEAILLLSLVALYQLHLFLQRRRYLNKAHAWVHRQRRQLDKFYKASVRRIAKVSLVLAAMTSHLLFFSVAAALRLFLPRLVRAMANPRFISLFSWYAPLFFTITTLFEYKENQDDSERSGDQDSTAATRKNNQSNQAAEETKSSSSRRRRRRRCHGNSPNEGEEKAASPTATTTATTTTTTTNKQQSVASRIRRRSLELLPSSEVSLEAEMQDWLRFWIVRAFLEACKCLLAWVTPFWFTSSLLQLELVFYMWVYYLPFIQPDSIAGQALPEGRPLRVLCSFWGPWSHSLVNLISDAIPQDFWQSKVVGFASQICSALVLVRLLKQSTSDWLIHMVQEGRSLVIPALTLMTPGFLTRYGVVYVQYVLSTSKSYRDGEPDMGTTVLWLQYWVVHAVVDGVLSRLSPILWWTPFSTHAIFCFWCYLSVPQNIDRFYHPVEKEFQLFGVLPGQHEGKIEQTMTAQILLWLWEILPKGKDEVVVEQQLDPVEVVVVAPVFLEEPEMEVVEPPASPHKEIVPVDTSMTTEEEDDDNDNNADDFDVIGHAQAVDDDSDNNVSHEDDDPKSDNDSEAEAVVNFDLEEEDDDDDDDCPRMMTRAARKRAEQEARERGIQRRQEQHL